MVLLHPQFSSLTTGQSIRVLHMAKTEVSNPRPIVRSRAVALSSNQRARSHPPRRRMAVERNIYTTHLLEAEHDCSNRGEHQTSLLFAGCLNDGRPLDGGATKDIRYKHTRASIRTLRDPIIKGTRCTLMMTAVAPSPNRWKQPHEVGNKRGTHKYPKVPRYHES